MSEIREYFRSCGDLFGLMQRDLHFGELSMRMGNRVGPAAQSFVLFRWAANASGRLYSQEIAVGLEELNEFDSIDSIAGRLTRSFKSKLAAKVAQDRKPDIVTNSG